MNISLIFSNKVLLESGFGFAGLSDFKKNLQKKQIKFSGDREHMAEVVKIDGVSIEDVEGWLPENLTIPVIIEGKTGILSNKQLKICNQDDQELLDLLKDAHLRLVSEVDSTLVSKKDNINLEDIDRMCDEFSDSIGLIVPFKEFNINDLFDNINIAEEYEHKLIGMLVDIKTIWFAIDYDMFQLASSTQKDSVSRFKRYMYINNAIIRIRALWEKLMGLAVLLESPEMFDKTFAATKVRSFFIKNFSDAKNPATKKIWDVLHTVDNFEQRFRTPELHKIGRTIRWATQDSIDGEMNRLLGHKNDLNKLLRDIVEIINDKK